MAFEGSSHQKHWIFGKEQVDDLRRQANADAIEAIKQVYTDHPQDAGRPPPEEFLTPEDECVLVQFYADKIPGVVEAVGLGGKVVGTSCTLFRRFYLTTSVLEYDPKEVYLAAVFLGSKAEDAALSPSFVSKFRGDPERLRELEVVLLERTRFHLVVHGIGYPLDAFCSMMEEVDSSIDGPELRAAAHEYATDAVLTDVVLLYPPSQIALACLCLAAGEMQLAAERFVAAQFPGEKSDLLLATLGQIQDSIRAALDVEPDVERLKSINAARKEMCNPLLDPESHLAVVLRKRRQDQAEAAQLKRYHASQAAKAEEMKRLTGFAPSSSSSSSSAPTATNMDVE